MSSIERLTITLPFEMASIVKMAVQGGDYASTSEVVREALRDWKMKKALQNQALEELRSDIDAGLADLEAGRLVDPDIDRIMELGRKRAALR
jgi:antitoxin ParD1/3/4